MLNLFLKQLGCIHFIFGIYYTTINISKMIIFVGAPWLLMFSLILLPVSIDCCTSCYARSRFNCFGDGCYVSGKRCFGSANCDSYGGGGSFSDDFTSPKEPTCYDATCKGTPTNDLCAEGFENTTKTYLDCATAPSDFFVSGFSNCIFSDPELKSPPENRTCTISPTTCTYMLSPEMKKDTCVNLGCEYTDAYCDPIEDDSYQNSSGTDIIGRNLYPWSAILSSIAWIATVTITL